MRARGPRRWMARAWTHEPAVQAMVETVRVTPANVVEVWRIDVSVRGT